MEAISLYDPVEALKITGKRLDAALMGMQTLKTEIKHLKEQLEKERKEKVMWRQKCHSVRTRYKKDISGRGAKETRRYRLPQIREAVCRYFEIPEIPKCGNGRMESTKYPRQLYIYLAYTMTPVSFPELAKELNADHSTIMSSKNRVKYRYDANADHDPCREDVDNLREILNGGERTRCVIRPARDNHFNCKAVEKVTPHGDVLHTYPSLSAAAEGEGVHITTVNSILKGRTKKSRTGLYFRYKQD